MMHAAVGPPAGGVESAVALRWNSKTWRESTSAKMKGVVTWLVGGSTKLKEESVKTVGIHLI